MAVAVITKDGAAEFSNLDRKSTRLNSSHDQMSYAVFCLKKKDENHRADRYSRIRYPFLREALHRIQLHAGQPEPLSLRHRLHLRPGLVRRFLFAHPATQPLEPALGVVWGFLGSEVII